MIEDVLKKLLYSTRRESLKAARAEREIVRMIEDADAAILADDEGHTSATEREIVRTVSAIVRRIGADCAACQARCRDCPYADTGRYSLVDGRTLCDVAKEITRAIRDEHAARERLTDAENELVRCTERVEDARRRYLDDVENAERVARAELEAAKDNADATRKTLDAAAKRYGVTVRE